MTAPPPDRQAIREQLEEAIAIIAALIDGDCHEKDNYCWWCEQDINGINQEKQPHLNNCRWVRAQRAIKAAADLIAVPEAMPVSPSAPVILAVVDGRCGCSRCRGRTENIYRMIGFCWNCGAEPFLMLFREGDPVAALDCPRCGNRNTVHCRRPATDNEIPVAAERDALPVPGADGAKQP